MKHPDIQVFWEGKTEPIYDLWYIQKNQSNLLNFTHSILSENDNQNESINDEKNLEVYDSLNLDNNPIYEYQSPFENIKPQELFNDEVKDIHELFKKLPNAYNDFLQKGESNYGYMLISKNFEYTKDHSIIILESNLLRFIRQLWYNKQYVDFVNQKQYDRITTICLNSYLDRSRYKVFLNLFPHYQSYFTHFENIKYQLVNDVYLYIRNKMNNSNISSNNTTYQISNEIIKYMANEVSNKITLNLQNKPKVIISKIIHAQKYLDIYYKIFESNNLLE